MRIVLRSVLAVMFVAGLGGVALAEEVENPIYAAWAKQKVGTTVTYKSVSQSTGTAATEMPVTETTRTLKEVKPNAVVLEVISQMGQGGRTMTVPARTVEIPAKIDKEHMGLPAELFARAQAEVKDVKEGKESLALNGKNYNASTRECTLVTNAGMQMTSHVKVWYSADVPGGFLKSETKTEAPRASTTTVTLESVK